MTKFTLKDMKCAYSEDGRVAVPYVFDDSNSKKIGYWAYPTEGNSSVFIDAIDENVVLALIAKMAQSQDLSVITMPEMIKTIGVDKIRGATFQDLRRYISVGRTINNHENEDVTIDRFCQLTPANYKIMKLIISQFKSLLKDVPTSEGM